MPQVILITIALLLSVCRSLGIVDNFYPVRADMQCGSLQACWLLQGDLITQCQGTLASMSANSSGETLLLRGEQACMRASLAASAGSY